VPETNGLEQPAFSAFRADARRAYLQT